MTANDLQKLRYPIGEFSRPEVISSKEINKWISSIENLPKSIEELTESLNENQLSYLYRPNGWTIKQVVHHCADSHMNSLMRFKLALTENTPTIRPYYEDRWAKLKDYKAPIGDAIFILRGVHRKLGVILRNLEANDLKRAFIHPEHSKHFSIDETIGMYAWHSNHHLAHIKQALHFKGKFN